MAHAANVRRGLLRAWLALIPVYSFFVLNYVNPPKPTDEDYEKYSFTMLYDPATEAMGTVYGRDGKLFSQIYDTKQRKIVEKTITGYPFISQGGNKIIYVDASSNEAEIFMNNKIEQDKIWLTQKTAFMNGPFMSVLFNFSLLYLLIFISAVALFWVYDGFFGGAKIRAIPDNSKVRIMLINGLLSDLVTLVKSSGQIIKKDIQASVQGNRIFMTDKDIPIESGDHLLRQLPNGLTEDYIVLQPDYRDGGDLSHWEVKTRRSTEPAASPQTIINHISGNNARVNISSTDMSKNNVAIQNEHAFREIIEALRLGIHNTNEREYLIDLVRGMQESSGTASFKEKYQNFIASASNHMTVVGPFLPFLTQYL